MKFCSEGQFWFLEITTLKSWSSILMETMLQLSGPPGATFNIYVMLSSLVIGRLIALTWQIKKMILNLTYILVLVQISKFKQMITHPAYILMFIYSCTRWKSLRSLDDSTLCSFFCSFFQSFFRQENTFSICFFVTKFNIWDFFLSNSFGFTLSTVLE